MIHKRMHDSNLRHFQADDMNARDPVAACAIRSARSAPAGGDQRVGLGRFERALGRPLLEPRRISAAGWPAPWPSGGRFAAGKLGGTERGWLMLPDRAEREIRPAPTARLRASRHRPPGDPPRRHLPGRRRRFCVVSRGRSREAVERARRDRDLPRRPRGRGRDPRAIHRLGGAPMHFEDQEPERSVPGRRGAAAGCATYGAGGS